MNLGLDYHGVCDRFPELFSSISRALIRQGDNVYIITGHEDTAELRDSLRKFGICYTLIVSVIDYHKAKGTHVWYDEKNTPWMDSELWNKAKAELCSRYDIDILIDDSELYGKYFTGKTKYILLKGAPANGR